MINLPGLTALHLQAYQLFVMVDPKQGPTQNLW